MSHATLTVSSETYTPGACWRSLCRSLAVLLLFLLKQRIRYRSCCWVDSLLRPCPALIVYHPVSWYLLHALERELGDSKPLCRMYRYVLLEELDYLCNLIGLQVQPHATSKDKDTNRTQLVKKDRATVCGHHM